MDVQIKKALEETYSNPQGGELLSEIDLPEPKRYGLYKVYDDNEKKHYHFELRDEIKNYILFKEASLDKLKPTWKKLEEAIETFKLLI